VPVELAKKEIERCAGQQFDPEVVRQFLLLTDEELDQTRSLAESTSYQTELQTTSKAK